MTTFLAALLRAPAGTPLSRYTSANGILYVVLGIGLYAFPTLVEAGGADELTGGEPGLLRLAGFSLAVIGWFYLMGGRTGATSFGLATVLNRIVFVPAFLLPLALTDTADPYVVVPIVVLDLVLGLGALAIWLTRVREPRSLET